MRRDEKFAKEAFWQYLRKRNSGPIRWRPGRNPPDYYMRIGKQSYAIEVTQIMESIDLESYIDVTQNLPVAEPIGLLKAQRGQGCSIEKLGGSNSLVGATFSIGGAKWQIEVQRELSQLLAGRVEVKRSLLQGVRLPIVLLLVDAYHYALSEDWIACAKEQDFDDFHTIVRVFGEFDSQVLMSQFEAWRPQLNMQQRYGAADALKDS